VTVRLEREAEDGINGLMVLVHSFELRNKRLIAIIRLKGLRLKAII